MVRAMAKNENDEGDSRYESDLREIDRRLKIFMSGIEVLQGEPDADTWRIVASLLISDRKIWEIIEAGKPGARKLEPDKVKYTLERLRDLALAFNNFEKRERAKVSKTRDRLPKFEKLVEIFQRELEGNNYAGFEWLPRGLSTLTQKIKEAKPILNYPVRTIDGRQRVLHPDVAVAYREYLALPSAGLGDTIRELLSLRHDLEEDRKRMAYHKMAATLRAHGAQAALDIALGLKKIV
jgi:hypothetical protein